MNSIAESTMAVPSSAAWRSVVQVFKPRIALEIMLAGVAGVAVTGSQGLPWWRLLALALAIFVAAGAAGALNHLVEADLDARMSRTRERPFVTGSLQAGPAWYLLVASLVAGAVALAGWTTNWIAAAFIFLGAFTYAVVYTLWLKRRTWLNIVIGGLAGSFAVLAGAAAVEPSLGRTAWLFALVLFLWTPPHFWSLATYYRDDYAAAGVPMLPVVHGERVAAWAIFGHTLPLVTLSLVPVVWGEAGVFYALCAGAGGAYFIWRAFLLLRRPSKSNAIRSFLASLLQLGLLLLGAIAEGAWSGSLVAL
ncbi:MAG TPA: heme o synthase [Steroidobacteraceae bacterium]|nr:heme o synthase [Steroidobacteraceae bacterium]